MQQAWEIGSANSLAGAGLGKLGLGWQAEMPTSCFWRARRYFVYWMIN